MQGQKSEKLTRFLLFFNAKSNPKQPCLLSPCQNNRFFQQEKLSPSTEKSV